MNSGASSEKKILVIDDEESVGQVVRSVLPRCEVRHELSGAGLAVAYFWRPDLLLIDLGLPDVQGEDLAKMVQADQLLGRTPIIFLSATRAWREEDQPNQLHGCAAFGKPFNVSVLRWYVESALSGETSER